MFFRSGFGRDFDEATEGSVGGFVIKERLKYPESFGRIPIITAALCGSNGNSSTTGVRGLLQILRSLIALQLSRNRRSPCARCPVEIVSFLPAAVGGFYFVREILLVNYKKIMPGEGGNKKNEESLNHAMSHVP